MPSITIFPVLDNPAQAIDPAVNELVPQEIDPEAVIAPDIKPKVPVLIGRLVIFPHVSELVPDDIVPDEVIDILINFQ